MHLNGWMGRKANSFLKTINVASVTCSGEWGQPQEALVKYI